MKISEQARRFGNRFDNLAGKKFGKLTAEYVVRGASGKIIYWSCICDCGGRATVRGSNLRAGNTKSCGCIGRAELLKAVTKHAMSWTQEYTCWRAMKSRCLNPKHKSFSSYGGRRIGVCPRWTNSFDNFINDMGRCPKGKSLERIDSNKGYCPSNCMWATLKQQRLNRCEEPAHSIASLLAKLKE